MIVAPERIPVAGPSITDREVELVADAARNAWSRITLNSITVSNACSRTMSA